jgi:hypothetical protein
MFSATVATGRNWTGSDTESQAWNGALTDCLVSTPSGRAVPDVDRFQIHGTIKGNSLTNFISQWGLRSV